MRRENHDFTKGSVAGNILQLAVPMIFAQLVNVLYSVVDRMYIGHLPQAAANALTGIGLTFPILSIILAFANLFGAGGAPLFAIARGQGEEGYAGHIMGNTFFALVLSGVVLTIAGFLSKEQLLFWFGASQITFPYANDYLTIYLLGTVFVMVGLGMNGFINAQGFGRIGMLTVVLGAGLNIVLDPIFIFGFEMGVRGAAWATVLSQGASALWAVHFLRSKRALIPLKREQLGLNFPILKSVVALGFAGFVFNITNSGVQIVCNATLKAFGGDLYIGVMTIINSIREVAIAPANGLMNAAQPVIGFNYGAGEYRRARQGIAFFAKVCIGYTSFIWLALLLFPRFFIGFFNNEATLIQIAVPAVHLYFFGFFLMSLQMTGQSAAVALGRSKQAVFFSLLRKGAIVIPLTLLLPRLGNLGVNGVFLAEPISNFIGGIACFATMFATIWQDLKRKEAAAKQ